LLLSALKPPECSLILQWSLHHLQSQQARGVCYKYFTVVIDGAS
jgi:hypothetical protein